jgi:hypothetical protein
MLCENFADQTEASETVQDDRMMSENNIQLMGDITLQFFLDKYSSGSIVSCQSRIFFRAYVPILSSLHSRFSVSLDLYSQYL